MENVILSVIIPYYKGINYIEKTVASIKTISHSKEILVIDDGSGDGSFDKLQKIYAGDDEVTVYAKKNGGIADTKNYGLERAKGEYLFFCDQDDIVVGETIDKAIDRFEEKQADAAFFSTEMFYEENRPNKACDTVLMDLTLEKRQIRNELLTQTLLHRPSAYCTQFMHLWMGVFRRKFVVDNYIGFKSFVDIEDDFLFIVDIMAAAEKVCLIPEVGYLWLQNRKSKSHTSKGITRYMDKSSNLFAYYRETAREAGVDPEMFDMIDRYCCQIQIVQALVEYSRLSKGPHKVSEKARILEEISSRRAQKYFDIYELNGEKRNRKVITFLRDGKVRAAFSYVHFWNIYMEFRKRAGAILWEKIR